MSSNIPKLVKMWLDGSDNAQWGRGNGLMDWFQKYADFGDLGITLVQIDGIFHSYKEETLHTMGEALINYFKKHKLVGECNNNACVYANGFQKLQGDYNDLCSMDWSPRRAEPSMRKSCSSMFDDNGVEFGEKIDKIKDILSKLYNTDAHETVQQLLKDILSELKKCKEAGVGSQDAMGVYWKKFRDYNKKYELWKGSKTQPAPKKTSKPKTKSAPKKPSKPKKQSAPKKTSKPKTKSAPKKTSKPKTKSAPKKPSKPKKTSTPKHRWRCEHNALGDAGCAYNTKPLPRGSLVYANENECRKECVSSLTPADEAFASMSDDEIFDTVRWRVTAAADINKAYKDLNKAYKDLIKLHKRNTNNIKRINMARDNIRDNIKELFGALKRKKATKRKNVGKHKKSFGVKRKKVTKRRKQSTKTRRCKR